VQFPTTVQCMPDGQFIVPQGSPQDDDDDWDGGKKGVGHAVSGASKPKKIVSLTTFQIIRFLLARP